MRACLLGRSTTRAIHSFDDFIWTRELSALAIMRYCLPFDSVATARAAMRQRETIMFHATPSLPHAAGGI